MSRNVVSPMRFRQVHLDFHTSEHIDGIGADFDPETFVSTLKARMSIPSRFSPSATMAGPTIRQRSASRIHGSPARI